MIDLNDIFNVVITICRWYIWKRRNNFIYENDIMSESELFQWVKSELKQHFALIKRIVLRMVNTRWTPSGEWMLDTILCTF